MASMAAVARLPINTSGFQLRESPAKVGWERSGSMAKVRHLTSPFPSLLWTVPVVFLDRKPVVLAPPGSTVRSCGSNADAPCSSSPSAFGTEMTSGRRKVIFVSTIGIVSGFFLNSQIDKMSMATEFTDMPALRGKDYGKSKMKYPDYTETESGLQYKDLRLGDGPTPKVGETVVVDWDGYTIGYYGRIFEARNKTKGGSFEGDDKDFFKFKIGSNKVIPAFEEAVSGMALGGIRRIIVPPELGYPDNDYRKLGPKPATFSGQRALDFVLRNQGLIDKTLLFDIELIKVLQD